MQIDIKHQLIQAAVKDVGRSFLADFRKSPIPQNFNDLMNALATIEKRCLDVLTLRLKNDFPGIPWAEDNEFDDNTQIKPLALEQYWLCDTMDGAIQYVQHIAGWTINLVLIRHGRPHLAVIYDPLLDELFWAEEGQGAFLNGEKIKLSKRTDRKNMLAVMEYGHQLKKKDNWEETMPSAFGRLLHEFGVVRNYGPHGLQLAYVGAGRIDLFLQKDLDTHNWLAGMLIAREAGARILTAEGIDWQWGSDSILVGTQQATDYFLGL